MVPGTSNPKSQPKEEKNKQFLKSSFGTYISPELIDEMYESGKEPELGGEEGYHTAFFTDIQSFSAFSEKLSASDLVSLLNTVPLGYHPIPVINIKNGNGKKLLVIGGNHGDEFEGPSAIMRVSQEISVNDINGQILLIPGLSFDAITQSRRTNPLDDKNMNRAFPGNPDGSPTEMLAAYLENDLMQNFDAIIDFHSGGKASVFMPCSLVYKSEDEKLFQKNLALAKAFGIANIWVLGENNDNRSLNSAAGRANIPMIATELGGGGGINPKMTNMAELGIFNILNHLKIYKGRNAEPASKFETIEIRDPSASIYSPAYSISDQIGRAHV